MTITTTPKSSPTQHANANKSGGDTRESSTSPPTKVSKTSSSSTSYHSNKPASSSTLSETSSSTSSANKTSSSPSHQQHPPKSSQKEKDPYHFSTKKESKFDLEESRALLKSNKERSTKSPAKAITERKHSTASVGSSSGGNSGTTTHSSNQLTTSCITIVSGPMHQNGKLTRVPGGGNLATPPLIPSTPSFREENNNYNGSSTGSIGGSSAEENNNALPAEYWLNRQPMADQIVITDVTVCDMTVTIRECKTKTGFFRARDHNDNSDNRNNHETDTKIIALNDSSKALINTNTNASTGGVGGNALNKKNINPVSCQNGGGGGMGVGGGNSPAGFLHRLQQQQQSATSVSSGK